MKFDVDLTKAETLSNLPDGSYILQIVNSQVKKSKANNDKIVWEARVLQPQEVAQKTPRVFFDTTVVEAALFKIKELYEACKVPIRATGFDSVELHGKQVGAIFVLQSSPEFGDRSRPVKFLPIEKTRPGLKAVPKPIVGGVAASG